MARPRAGALECNRASGGRRGGPVNVPNAGGTKPASFIGTLAPGMQVDPGHTGAKSHKSLRPPRVLSFSVAVPDWVRLATMRIALYEPDIPQNTGTILRLAACLGLAVHVIEPAGFPVSDRAFRRAGMDYLDQVDLTRHDSWRAFETWRRQAHGRLVLFTTRANGCYLDHAYNADEILLFGRESSGVPQPVHAAADARLRIPMRAGMRSLNVAMACAMAAGEALRQMDGFAR